jgi:peptidyl-prolyl cis-trans isomerase SurA
MGRVALRTKSGLWREARVAAALFGVLVSLPKGLAQTPEPASESGQAGASSGDKVGDQGELLDRVIAVVNGDLVLESDVEEEKRFAVFQPLRNAGSDYSRASAIERLINRALILQQLKLQPQPPITDKALDTELTQLRNAIPECKPYHCETDAGWEKFVADQGFTMPEFRERWRHRMEVLRFIEQRFRMGIRISPEEIKTYYDKTLVPQYAKQKVTPPKLETISERIQEVLLQQQVGSLLGDWLKSLRVQGSVRILGQGDGVAQ